MNAHRNDLDDRGPADRPTCGGYVPTMVERGLARADTDWHRTARITDGGDLARAARADRLAAICTRRAAWWTVLARWAYQRAYRAHDPVPVVFGTAAHTARARELSDARFWSELAADWRARAEQRPTSDAAGALSNWDELGVTA